MTAQSIFRPDAVPAAAEQFARRGVAVLGPPALPADLHTALTTEARTQHATQSWALTGTRARGEIEQSNRRACLGPVARGFLGSDQVATFLHAATGRALAPSWSATCYTHYRGPGEHVGEHCDKADACAVALLVYLEAVWPGPSPGPGLQLFVFQGDNSSTGLAAVVTTHSNRCVVLDGAKQAHLRPPLAPGESMLMLAGCFRAA
jgi:hypothetical protein